MKDHLKQQSLCTHKWIKDKYVLEKHPEKRHSVMGVIWTTLAAAFLEDTCGEIDSCWAQSENFVKAMIQQWNYRLPSSVALVKDNLAGLQGTVEYALSLCLWSEVKYVNIMHISWRRFWMSGIIKMEASYLNSVLFFPQWTQWRKTVKGWSSFEGVVAMLGPQSVWDEGSKRWVSIVLKRYREPPQGRW